jgi:hypothetical protein
VHPGGSASPAGAERRTLAVLATAAIRQLRVAGSRCCAGRADDAWRRTLAREQSQAGRDQGQAGRDPGGADGE